MGLGETQTWMELARGLGDKNPFRCSTDVAGQYLTYWRSKRREVWKWPCVIAEG